MNRRRRTFILVISVVFVTVVASVVLAWSYWDQLKSDTGTTIRNLGLVIGGFIAVVLALWRSRIAERQIEVAETRSLDEQFQRAAEMLGHEQIAVRLGGIASLRYLAFTHFDRYGRRIYGILQSYPKLQGIMRLGRFSESENTGHEVIISMTHFESQIKSYAGTIEGGGAFAAYMDIDKLMIERSLPHRKRWWKRIWSEYCKRKVEFTKP